MPQTKFDQKLDHAWNAGLRLREVPRFMARFGFGDSDVSAMIEGWRARKKEFGCRCIVRPPGWSYGQEEREAAANATIVTSRMFGGSGTYADWSGSTGPGALLRKILKEEREKKDE